MTFQILADENMPFAVVEVLAKRGHAIISVSTHSPGILDGAVLDLANQMQRLLITFDKDFGEIIFRRGRTATFGIVLFRLGLLPAAAMADRISNALETRTDWANHFSVIDQRHIRMIPLRTPGPQPSTGQ